mmetsp:Transcript_23386/g.35022  ORF Transcript_23386/g.35022 Transcript_23386/m.35022 type:complete len:107 (-) Transcript_23386:5-325(-)
MARFTSQKNGLLLRKLGGGVIRGYGKVVKLFVRDQKLVYMRHSLEIIPFMTRMLPSYQRDNERKKVWDDSEKLEEKEDLVLRSANRTRLNFIGNSPVRLLNPVPTL